MTLDVNSRKFSLPKETFGLKWSVVVDLLIFKTVLNISLNNLCEACLKVAYLTHGTIRENALILLQCCNIKIPFTMKFM